MTKLIYLAAIMLVPALCVAASAVGGSSPSKLGPVTVAGSARFTVITPQCIRMEYSPEGKFVDAPSMFAANRKALGTATIKTQDGATVIDTGVITLVYKPDGQPFSPGNLSASIRDVTDLRRTVEWKPGMPNNGNLGGTTRTLDGWNGPGKLDDGILSRDGWYLLDDSRGQLLTSDWVESRPASAGTDWYLFGYGRDFRAALKSLTAIGGPVPLPRKYGLGVWYSRYWPYTSEEYRQIVKEYAQHDFPLDVMVMDMDWHKDGWTGWSWNRKLLPDAEKLLPWFHEQGLAVTMNLHPADGIAPHEDMYEPFMRDMGADPVSKQTIPFDAGSKKYLDTLFKYAIVPHEKEWVDFWWLDWQQYPFTRSVPDLTNLAWLNVYFYNHTGENGRRGMSFSRWAGWGDHRHPVHFSGDASTGWRMLAFEVPFTSTAGNVGCFFWSHDIGGHMGGRNEESYTRWCQFGALTAALRSHSTRSADLDRRPWTYPKWAEDSMRISFHLRSQLMPYIYSSAWESCRESIPLNRPTYLVHPADERAYRNPQQFLYGDNILAAPVTMPGAGPNRVGWQTVWFPDGIWYNLFTGERFESGTEHLVAADINEFPVYARGGVPIPMQPYTPRMATDPLKTLVVRCYPGTEGQTGEFTLYEDDGLTTDYTKGKFATTKLTCTTSKGTTTVKVLPTSGSYKGQPAERSYVIEIAGARQAKWGTIDGKPAEVAYDAKTRTNKVSVRARKIKMGVTVQFEVAPADIGWTRMEEAARRAGTTREDLGAAVSAAMDGKGDAGANQATLASVGVGFIAKNEAVYMFPEKMTTCFYLPENLRDNDKLNWSLVERTSAGEREVASAESAITGSCATVPEMRTSGIPSSPDSELILKVEWLRGGKMRSLYGPGARWDLRNADKNVAPKAKVTVSSTQSGTGAAGATDGVIDGYPHDHRFEWAAGGEAAGAWIRLDWDKEQTIDRIWLFDRLNETDQVTSGELMFSDGSKIDVGELTNNASSGADVKFSPKTVKWVKFTVTGVKEGTQNTGLAEIIVWAAG